MVLKGHLSADLWGSLSSIQEGRSVFCNKPKMLFAFFHCLDSYTPSAKAVVGKTHGIKLSLYH